MPATMTVRLRNIPDTEAAVAWSGGHTIVVDRPEGKAGGMSLGLNGGQLLGVAIGGCLCNDLRCVAAEMGVSIATIVVDVVVTFEGNPLLATAASVEVAVTSDDPGADIAGVVAKARDVSTVSNSIQRGLPV